MRIRDIGIIVGKYPLKESSYIISVLTENHGLYSAVVRDSKNKSGSIYQKGNIIDFTWQARLHEHIGNAKCELIKSHTNNLMYDKTKLYAFNSLTSIIKLAFHEREPHNQFFPKFMDYLNDSVIHEFCFRSYVNCEIDILSASGYGLQLDKCAVTNEDANLHYVSPKSGKAVSKEAGLAYKDKLLLMPSFLKSGAISAHIEPYEKNLAFQLTGYFFNRYCFSNGKQPRDREIFIEHVIGDRSA